MADITGLAELERTLKNLRRVAPSACRVALKDCGKLAMREAKINAPRSPTMKEQSSSLKRRKRTASKKSPGGLEKSIFFEVKPYGWNDFVASVFVPKNALCVSPKGFNYAKRIHDEQGKTWFKVGPGNSRKPKAGGKFIFRAIKENVDKYTAIVEAALQKELRRI